jgi:hypothetical protein
MQRRIPKPDLHDPVQRLDPTLLEDVTEPPPAEDRLPDEEEAERGGQRWLETMEATAVENGTERQIDQMIDEEISGHDLRHRKNGDPPVADRGAGGRRGI